MPMTWLLYTVWSTATFLLALPFALAALALRVVCSIGRCVATCMEALAVVILRVGGW